MRTALLGALASFVFLGVPAAQAGAQVAWRDCLAQPPGWYAGSEAIAVADNVLLYQRRSGGWPKNIDMAAPLAPADRAKVGDEKELNDSTIDNGATYTQMRFLARVYAASRQDRFRDAFLGGFDYLLAAQYRNGGWPQFYPLRTNYSRHITFNDDAMIGVMTLLREAANGAGPFEFVDAARRQRARCAIDRGIEVILQTQVRVNGKLTAWCAQHDEVTLKPASARAYEHVSLAGRESVGIVRYLMEIEKPDARVAAAIEGAVQWFRRVRIDGLRISRPPGPDPAQRPDAVVVKDASAPPLWARFYEIGTDRPIFSGRDGVVRASLAEIEFERRANYNWYGDWPAELLARDYPAWKARTIAK